MKDPAGLGDFITAAIVIALIAIAVGKGKGPKPPGGR